MTNMAQLQIADTSFLSFDQSKPYNSPPSVCGVYGLVDPIDMQVKYVGVSKNIKKRFLNHLTIFILGNKKSKWIESLASKGLIPYCVVLEVINQQQVDMFQREKLWVEHFFRMGSPLLNSKNLGRKKGAYSFNPDRIIALHAEGMNIKSISVALKCSTKTIQRALHARFSGRTKLVSKAMTQGRLFHETL